MLFSTAIIASTLESAGTAVGGRHTRDALLGILDLYGILLGGRSDALALLDEVKRFPAEVAQWGAVLQGLPMTGIRSAAPTWKAVGDLPTGEDTLIVGPGPTVAPWLQAIGANPHDGYCRLDGTRTDIAVAQSAYNAGLVRERNLWSDQVLTGAMKRDEFWDTRLRPLFATTRRATFVDRFLFTTLAEGVFRDSDTSENGGLWVFDQVGNLELKGVDRILISLYSQVPDPPWDEVSYLEQIADELWSRCSGPVRELLLFPYEPGRLSGVDHDRYWRFSTDHQNRVVDFGNSITIFAKSHFNSTCRFGYGLAGHNADHYRQAEKAMAHHSKARGPIVRS